MTIESEKSELEKLQTNSQLMTLVVESASDAIIIFNKQGHIFHFNMMAEKIFGRPRYQVENKILLYDLLTTDSDTPFDDDFIDDLLTQYIGQRIILQGKHAHAPQFAAEFSLTPLYFAIDDDPVYAAFIQNISDQLKLEDEKEQALKAKVEAEQSSTAKSAFLANMSHELRTPLNAIIGYSELLTDMSVEDKLDKYQQDLQNITHSAGHLLSLIDEVLDVSKIDAGEMILSLESFNIHDMITDMSQTIIPLVTQNANQLIPTLSNEVTLIHSDPARIRQILFNFLSNACKFTHSGYISLMLKPHEDTPDWLTLEVGDTGIGLTPEQQQKVFDPFTQADSSSTREVDGTGLGLSLCRRFCHMLGGTIEVKSPEGQGATFSVHLPLTAPQITNHSHTTAQNHTTNTEKSQESDDDEPRVTEQFRKHHRHYINDGQIIIHRPDQDIQGTLINLSESGILAKITHTAGQIAFMKNNDVSLILPEGYPVKSINRLPCTVARIHELQWQDEETIEQMNIAWEFYNLSEQQQDELRVLMNMINTQTSQ
jgi:PAS domain S-box-containing protein